MTFKLKTVHWSTKKNLKRVCAFVNLVLPFFDSYPILIFKINNNFMYQGFYCCTMLVWVFSNYVYIFCHRSWLRNMHDRHLHGYVLQHYHRLGGVLPGSVAGVHKLRTTLDQLWQWMEYTTLHAGHVSADQP